MTAEPRSLDDAPALDHFLQTCYLLEDVSRLRRMLYDQRSRHLRITRAQWRVLFSLSRRDEPLRNQQDLAQLLEMGSAAVGELLLRLEKSGFIRRRRIPGDRRCKEVLIADLGREVLEHTHRVAAVNHETAMAGISMDERRLFDDLLLRMKRNLVASIAVDDETPPDLDQPPRCPSAGHPAWPHSPERR